MLDFIAGWGYNSRVTDNGLVAQLGAHHIRIVGVGSSNLLKSTMHERSGRLPPVGGWVRIFLSLDILKNENIIIA